MSMTSSTALQSIRNQLDGILEKHSAQDSFLNALGNGGVWEAEEKTGPGDATFLETSSAVRENENVPLLAEVLSAWRTVREYGKALEEKLELEEGLAAIAQQNRAKVRATRGEARALLRQHSEARAKVASEVDAVRGHVEDVELAREGLNAAQSQLAAVQAELKSMGTEDEIKEQLSSARKSLNLAQSIARESSILLNKAQTDLGHCHSSHQAKLQQSQKARTELRESTRKLASLEAQLTQAAVDQTEHHKEVEEQKKRLHAYEHYMQQLGSIPGADGDQTAGMAKQTIQGLRDRLERLQSDVSDQDESISSLSVEDREILDQVREYRQQTKREAIEMTKSLLELAKRGTEHNKAGDSSGLMSQLAERQTRAKIDLEQAQQRLTSTDAFVAELTQAVSAESARRRQLEALVDSSHASEEEYLKCRDNYTDLVSNMLERQNNSEKDVAERQKRVRDLTSRLDGFLGDSSQLQQNEQVAKRDVERAYSELESVATRLKDVRATLDVQVATLEPLAKELERKQVSIESLQIQAKQSFSELQHVRAEVASAVLALRQRLKQADL